MVHPSDTPQEIAADCLQNNFIQQYHKKEINQQNLITISNVHIMSAEFILCVAFHLYLHPYVHSYPCSGFIQQKISDMLNKNSLGLLKKGRGQAK